MSLCIIERSFKKGEWIIWKCKQRIWLVRTKNYRASWQQLQRLEGQGEGLDFHDRVKSSHHPVLLSVQLNKVARGYTCWRNCVTPSGADGCQPFFYSVPLKPRVLSPWSGHAWIAIDDSKNDLDPCILVSSKGIGLPAPAPSLEALQRSVCRWDGRLFLEASSGQWSMS